MHTLVEREGNKMKAMFVRYIGLRQQPSLEWLKTVVLTQATAETSGFEASDYRELAGLQAVLLTSKSSQQTYLVSMATKSGIVEMLACGYDLAEQAPSLNMSEIDKRVLTVLMHQVVIASLGYLPADQRAAEHLQAIYQFNEHQQVGEWRVMQLKDFEIFGQLTGRVFKRQVKVQIEGGIWSGGQVEVAVEQLPDLAAQVSATVALVYRENINLFLQVETSQFPCQVSAAQIFVAHHHGRGGDFTQPRLALLLWRR